MYEIDVMYEIDEIDEDECWTTWNFMEHYGHVISEWAELTPHEKATKCASPSVSFADFVKFFRNEWNDEFPNEPFLQSVMLEVLSEIQWEEVYVSYLKQRDKALTQLKTLPLN